MRVWVKNLGLNNSSRILEATLTGRPAPGVAAEKPGGIAGTLVFLRDSPALPGCRLPEHVQWAKTPVIRLTVGFFHSDLFCWEFCGLISWKLMSFSPGKFSSMISLMIPILYILLLFLELVLLNVGYFGMVL